MAKKQIKTVKILGDDVTVSEEYYLNNKNLLKSSSTFEYTPKMIKELAKCRKDIVYFAENYFFINGMYGKEIINLFGKQKEILSTIQQNQKTLLITSRQWGKTTLMTIVAIWTALFNPDQTIAIVANKEKTAIEIFSRCRLAFQQMDNWIKGGVVEFAKTYMTLANGSTIVTSATSPDAIRGFSIDVLLLDEFAIIPPKDANDFWAAVTPTLSTRLINNKNAKLIVASTPKGVGNKFHELVSDARAGKNDFVVREAMWYDVPGRDEKFKADEITTLGPDLFRQEYECEFLNNSGSPFNVAMFDKFEAIKKDPIEVFDTDDCSYLLWAKPDPNRIYTMGVDTAEGTGCDNSVLQIFDITDPLRIEQVARCSSNLIDPMSWAQKVYDIARQWYSPLALVERNGPGTTVCDKFFYEWSYPRMVNFGAKAAGAARAGRAFMPGIIALRDMKGRAVSNMKMYISDRRTVAIYDPITIDELRTFAHKKTGSGNYKWTALDGFHDDHVMALAWALFPLHELILNDWLIATKRDMQGNPLALKRRWTIDMEKDYDDPNRPSIYRGMGNGNMFVGAIVFQSGLNSNTIAQQRIDAGYQSGDTQFRELLDYGMAMSMDEYREQANRQWTPSMDAYSYANSSVRPLW